MSSSRFIELCDKWGIRYIPIHSNWATHNRAGHGEFGDMRGVVIHHTGSDGKTADQNSILWNGYGNLPGPLCHAGIATSGILQLAGWGRTNHAGLGSQSTLDLITDGLADFTHVISPGPATVDGNAHFYGFEIMYSGDHAMTDAQRKTAVRVTAAICTEHGWGPDVIGHGEWQRGKWDPGISHDKMMRMDVFRDEVHQAIKEGPKPPAQGSIYTVKEGDTLISIAKAKLHDQGRWDELVLLNPSVINLKPGTTIKLPS